MTPGLAGERIVRGQIVTFVDRPANNTDDERSLDHETCGALVIGTDGRIVWRGNFGHLPEMYQGLACDDYGESLVLPGFIDAHIHFPQYRMLAVPASDLLAWLNRFAFAEEARYAVGAHARAAAEQFLDRLIQHGTTTAVAYSSVHRGATDVLFEAAHARTYSLLAGKTLMDRHAPDAILDNPVSGIADSEALISAWHRRDRLRYVITVRFAITSSNEQLAAAGDLYRTYSDCLMQTHLSESVAEIERVRSQFPWSRDYTDVYDRFGLVGDRSLFGHGIHLSERECQRLHDAGATVVHCPTSNTFLGSGLFDIGHINAPDRPVQLGIASDVGGGTSYSMLQTLAEAYKIARLQKRQWSVLDAFHLATLGNARCLGLSHEVGVLDVDYWADLVVLDPCATAVLAARHELSESLEDVLFALMMLGDDRSIEATYVAGKRQHTRP